MPNPRVTEVTRLLFRTTGHTHTPFSKPDMVARIKGKPKISTQSIDFKAPHSAKSKQAWRYPGGVIQRAPSQWIGGHKYVDPKDPDLPRRKQESNFFITINTNKSTQFEAAGATEIGVRQAEKMLKALAEERTMATYIKFGPKSAEYLEDKYMDVIHSIDWKAAVEIGPQIKRIHAHIWLTITHYSQIQINVKMLMHRAREAYNDDEDNTMAGTNLRITEMPYVHVKLLPQGDWTSVMRQYIHKGMQHSTVQNA